VTSSLPRTRSTTEPSGHWSS